MNQGPTQPGDYAGLVPPPPRSGRRALLVAAGLLAAVLIGGVIGFFQATADYPTDPAAVAAHFGEDVPQMQGARVDALRTRWTRFIIRFWNTVEGTAGTEAEPLMLACYRSPERPTRVRDWYLFACRKDGWQRLIEKEEPASMLLVFSKDQRRLTLRGEPSGPGTAFVLELVRIPASR